MNLSVRSLSQLLGRGTLSERSCLSLVMLILSSFPSCSSRFCCINYIFIQITAIFFHQIIKSPQHTNIIPCLLHYNKNSPRSCWGNRHLDRAGTSGTPSQTKTSRHPAVIDKYHIKPTAWVHSLIPPVPNSSSEMSMSLSWPGKELELKKMSFQQ